MPHSINTGGDTGGNVQVNKHFHKKIQAKLQKQSKFPNPIPEPNVSPIKTPKVRSLDPEQIEELKKEVETITLSQTKISNKTHTQILKRLRRPKNIP